MFNFQMRDTQQPSQPEPAAPRQCQVRLQLIRASHPTAQVGPTDETAAPVLLSGQKQHTALGIPQGKKLLGVFHSQALSLRHLHCGHAFSPLNTSSMPYTHRIFLFSTKPKSCSRREQAEHKLPKKGSLKV